MVNIKKEKNLVKSLENTEDEGQQKYGVKKCTQPQSFHSTGVRCGIRCGVRCGIRYGTGKRTWFKKASHVKKLARWKRRRGIIPLK